MYFISRIGSFFFLNIMVYSGIHISLPLIILYFEKMLYFFFSELNLAVAAHVSDRILDEVIDRLSKSHKTLVGDPRLEKTGFLPMRKQSCRSAVQ